MKKLMFLGAVAGAFLVMAGCSSLQTVDAKSLSGLKLTAGNDVAHISASNCGLYLLWIPLITGSSDSVGGVDVFGDDPVAAASVAKLVTAKAKELGATKTVDMVSTAASGGFIFYWKQTYVSANAVK